MRQPQLLISHPQGLMSQPDVNSKDMEQTLNKNEAVIKFYWEASYANVACLNIFDTKKCFVSQNLEPLCAQVRKVEESYI